MANLEVFEAYFRKADLNQDGKISGEEAVAFFQGSNLPKPVLAQIWMHADQNRTGFLGRQEFYNALKLVTVAQSGRELAPEIVKSALYGPAAAKIPAPKINTVPSPATQTGPLAAAGLQRSSLAPSTQMRSMGSLPPTQSLGFKGPQAPPANVGLTQQLFSSNSILTRPSQSTPSSQMPGVNQGLAGKGSMAGPQLPSTTSVNLSTDWLGNRTGGASAGSISQSPLTGISPSQKLDGFSFPLSSTSGMAPRPQTQAIPSSALPPKPLDSLPSAGLAANDSKALVVSGNGFSSASNFGGDVFSAASQTKASALPPTFPASSIPNSSNFTSAASGFQNVSNLAQLDPLHSTPRIPPGGSQPQPTQSVIKQDQSTPAIAALNAGTASSASGQPQPQWPKVAQADIQKYTKVFVEVDKDRDGKITGEQARNLFLSWRLPREVLKQVWDLSDQDNDSMLSLREFCIALYLMERYREGHPLPAALPDTLKYDETLLRATGLPSTAYGGPMWQQNPGLSQGIPGARPLVPGTGIRPPTQSYMPPQAGTVLQPGQQKSGMLSADNHRVNQVNRNEQSTASSEYQPEIDTDKKVQVMEKQILDSREKIEFYRTMMQELVLYKSRCDNRLNEITERASADKQEVDSLGKKYEEKYKQVGDLASKLALEDATFRHVQERKVELQNAIVKMEQGGTADGLLQVRADRIQYDLEELEKALSERCKHYGLHVKPATSIELPFGWQPGVHEGATDWDENWDEFEDEGFVLAKDLNAKVDNIVSHDNAKSSSVWNDRASMDEFSPVASSNGDIKNENHYRAGEQVNENDTAYEHSEEESARSPDSPGRSTLESPFHSSQFGLHDVSPHSKESHRDHVGAESTFSGDKYVDDPSWNFDDADSVWGSSTIHTEDANHRSMQNSFSGDFGLNPVRVNSPSADSAFGKKKSPFFEDSVPSSPLFSSGFSPKFNEGREDNSLNFGRFDSFRTEDSGFFPQDQHFSKFDSISSSRGEQLTRFDSVSSSRNFGHSRGFESFDEADPFGSTGPFKSSGSHSPPRF